MGGNMGQQPALTAMARLVPFWPCGPWKMKMVGERDEEKKLFLFLPVLFIYIRYIQSNQLVPTRRMQGVSNDAGPWSAMSRPFASLGYGGGKLRLLLPSARAREADLVPSGNMAPAPTRPSRFTHHTRFGLPSPNPFPSLLGSGSADFGPLSATFVAGSGFTNPPGGTKKYCKCKKGIYRRYLGMMASSIDDSNTHPHSPSLPPPLLAGFLRFASFLRFLLFFLFVTLF